MLVTRMLRDSRIAARDAAAMPFPKEETTPPVTKTYLAITLACVGLREFTPFCGRARRNPPRSPQAYAARAAFAVLRPRAARSLPAVQRAGHVARHGPATARRPLEPE